MRANFNKKKFFELSKKEYDNELMSFLMEKESYSNRDLAFLFANSKLFDIGTFLVEYNHFSLDNLKMIINYIKPRLNDKHIDGLLRSDWIEFAILWRLKDIEEECLLILSDETEDGTVSNTAVGYLPIVINLYDFPSFYDLLSNILENENYYNNVKLMAAFLLLRYTGDIKYVSEIKEIIGYDVSFLKECLSNILKAEDNQPPYFAFYTILLDMTK